MAHFIKEYATFNCKHTLKVSEWLASKENRSAELSRLVRLGAERGPDAVIRELILKDASFDTDADETSQESAGERPHPRVSKAPAPAPTLGKKAAAGVDPLKKAIAENDFETFNALESAKDRRTA